MTDPLLAAADRMWTTAYELDRIRGDNAVTDWVASKVVQMIQGTLPDDVATVERLAAAIESVSNRMAPHDR